MTKKKKKRKRAKQAAKPTKHRFGVLIIPKGAEVTTWASSAYDNAASRGQPWEEPDPRQAGEEEE